MFWKSKGSDDTTGSPIATQVTNIEHTTTTTTSAISNTTAMSTSATSITSTTVPRIDINLTTSNSNIDINNVIKNNDNDDTTAWIISFSATMVPFIALCYGHSKGVTGKIVARVCSSPIGPSGLLLLPFISLSMEKSIYDTVQCIQGINPKIIPSDRGGFPSGGGTALPSFSLLPVQQYNLLKHPTTITFYSFSKSIPTTTTSTSTKDSSNR